MILSADRRRLVTELAAEIAGFMRGYGEPAFHSYMSAFTGCCRELWRLGAAFPCSEGEAAAAEPAFDPEADMPPYFRVLPEAEIRSRIAALPEIGEEQFEGLMDAFLARSDYVAERFPLHRGWFTPSLGDWPLMDAFRTCGLAEQAGTRFRWSIAMVPYVDASWPGLWAAEGE
jgi:hypothetical protein